MEYLNQMSFKYLGMHLLTWREWIVLCPITGCFFFFFILAWLLIFMKIWQRVGCELQNEVQILVFLQQTMFASSQNLQALKGYSKITEEWFWWLMTQVGLVMMKATKWQIWWVRALGFGEVGVPRMKTGLRIWPWISKMKNSWWMCGAVLLSRCHCWCDNWQSQKIWVNVWHTGSSWLNWTEHPLYSVYMFTMFVLC